MCPMCPLPAESKHLVLALFCQLSSSSHLWPTVSKDPFREMGSSLPSVSPRKHVGSFYRWLPTKDFCEPPRCAMESAHCEGSSCPPQAGLFLPIWIPFRVDPTSKGIGTGAFRITAGNLTAFGLFSEVVLTPLPFSVSDYSHGWLYSWPWPR